MKPDCPRLNLRAEASKAVVSLNVSASKIKSNDLSVGEQSAIRAGDGGDTAQAKLTEASDAHAHASAKISGKALGVQ